MTRSRLLGSESGLAVLGAVLCLWALYAQQHYRVAIGTPERALAWVGVALAIFSACLTVRGWIEGWLEERHDALRALDAVATTASWLLRAYVLWAVVLLANAVLDGSPLDTRRATIEGLSRTETYFAYFVPLAWADVAFADGAGERRRVLLTPTEAASRWGGEPVEVQMRSGGLGLTRIVAVTRDDETGFRAVLQISPTAAMAWQGLLEIHAKRARWPEALEAARNYLQASAETGPVFGVLAERFQRHDYARSLEFARLMFDREKSFKTYTWLGWTLAKLGRHDEALPLLRHAITLDPESFWGYYHLGYAYRYAGDAANARTMFLEVLKRRPNYPEIEQELRSLP
jgi:tetratricopeptide (TPR) repeat protein